MALIEIAPSWYNCQLNCYEIRIGYFYLELEAYMQVRQQLQPATIVLVHLKKHLSLHPIYLFLLRVVQ